jgi:hypothetical protein
MTKKRHHYISDFLCKHFSADKISFYRYDQQEKKIVSVSTKDGFVQKHLYRLKKKDGGYSDKMEDFFSTYYESPASGAIKALVTRLAVQKNPEQLLSVPEFRAILQFCVLSHLRTPNKLNEIFLSQVRLVMTLTYIELELKKMPTDIDFSVNLNKDFFFIEIIKSVQSIVKELKDLCVHIYYHRSPDKYFILPDQPVALYSTDQREFGSSDLKIYFPVTSNILVSFERGKKYDTLTEVSGPAIDELNLLSCGRFYRYIACENELYLRNFIDTHKLSPEPIQSDESLEEDRKKIIEEVREHLKQKGENETILVNHRHGVRLISDPGKKASGLKKFWRSLIKKAFK